MEDLIQRETIGQDLQTQMFLFSQQMKKLLPMEEQQDSQLMIAQNQVRN